MHDHDAHSHSHGATHVHPIPADDRDERLSSTIQQLRKQGFKQTPQRAMVLKVLMEHQGHITADEILEHIRHENAAGFDLSTVYRTLHMLIDTGVVHEIRDGNTVAYELAEEEAHHHLMCKKCHEIQEIDHTAFESLTKKLLSLHNFTADIRHMAIWGVCGKCRKDS